MIGAIAEVQKVDTLTTVTLELSWAAQIYSMETQVMEGKLSGVETVKPSPKKDYIQYFQ